MNEGGSQRCIDERNVNYYIGHSFIDFQYKYIQLLQYHYCRLDIIYTPIRSTYMIIICVVILKKTKYKNSLTFKNYNIYTYYRYYNKLYR